MLIWHVARNAVIPTLTLLGLNIAYLVGSTVIVENVFALNGLGALLLSSISEPGLPDGAGDHAACSPSAVVLDQPA